MPFSVGTAIAALHQGIEPTDRLGDIERALVVNDLVPFTAVVRFDDESVRKRVEHGLVQPVVRAQERNEMLLAHFGFDIRSGSEFVRDQPIKIVVAVELSELYFFLVGSRILEVAAMTHVLLELTGNAAPLRPTDDGFDHARYHSRTPQKTELSSHSR